MSYNLFTVHIIRESLKAKYITQETTKLKVGLL